MTLSATSDTEKDDNAMSLRKPRTTYTALNTLTENVPSKQISWLHKISRLNVFLIGVATIVIPSAVGFLVFIWSQSAGGSVNGTFRDLVVHGWVVQAITITSVVLRFAISTSAGIATSMLASLVLEQRGTNIRSAPSISILRFVNSGPQSLLVDLQHTWKHNWRSTSTICLLCATTFLLQFASTLLTSDLGTGFLIGPSSINTTNSGISNANLDLVGLSTTLSGTPREFPLFGEYHAEDTATNATARGTGSLMRALLPFTSPSDRTSVKSFSGVTTVMDAKVTCVRPRVDEEHTVLYNVLKNEWVFNGTWMPDWFPLGLMNTPLSRINTANTEYFYLDIERNPVTWDRYNNTFYNVTVGGTITEALAEMVNLFDDGIYALTMFETWHKIPVGFRPGRWTLSLMPFVDGPVQLSSLDPRFPMQDELLEPQSSQYYTTNRMEHYKRDDPVRLLTGTSYLAINITNGDTANMPRFRNESGNLTDNINAAYLFATYEEGFAQLVMTPKKEKLVFTIPSFAGWEASISLCYDSFTSFGLDVNLTTEEALSEPSLELFNVTTNRFGAERVEAQLDYNTEQISRSVMSLQTTPAQLQTQMSQLYQDALQQNYSSFDQSFITNALRNLLQPNNFYILCPECTLIDRTPNYDGDQDLGGEIIAAATQQMFVDDAEQTGDLSLALSGYLTTVARMMYYEALPYFDVANQPIITNFETGLFPRRFTGLAIVLAALVVHVVIVAAVAVLFLRETRFSRIGDAAWQVVGQLQSDDLKDFLQESTMIPDDAVDKHIADAGMKHTIVELKLDESYKTARIKQQ